MTAQIEQSPRAGRELSVMPMTAVEVCMFLLAGAAMAAVGAAILLGLPAAGAVAAFLGLLCYLVGHAVGEACDGD